MQKSDRDGNVTDTIQATVGIPLGQSAVKWVPLNSLTVNEIAIPSADTPAGLFTKTGAYAIGLPTGQGCLHRLDARRLRSAVRRVAGGRRVLRHSAAERQRHGQLGGQRGGRGYTATQTFYDNLGRSQATIDPGGTMSYSVFDAQGNVTDTWSGTRGTATISTYANNLAIVEAFLRWSAIPPRCTTPAAEQTSSSSHSAYNADSDATATTQYVVSGLTLRA